MTNPFQQSRSSGHCGKLSSHCGHQLPTLFQKVSTSFPPIISLFYHELLFCFHICETGNSLKHSGTKVFDQAFSEKADAVRKVQITMKNLMRQLVCIFFWIKEDLSESKVQKGAFVNWWKGKASKESNFVPALKFWRWFQFCSDLLAITCMLILYLLKTQIDTYVEALTMHKILAGMKVWSKRGGDWVSRRPLQRKTLVQTKNKLRQGWKQNAHLWQQAKIDS